MGDCHVCSKIGRPSDGSSHDLLVTNPAAVVTAERGGDAFGEGGRKG